MTEDFKRKLTAILSADVEGYSRLMGEDEDSTVRTLKAYRKLMSSLIERFNGRVVDSPGDNLLAEFESVRDAVQSAVEIQEELTIKNIELPANKQMKFRIGINLGDVIHDEDRIYGDGINVASRVESLAEGGGICISGTVYDSIKNKLSMNYEFLGEHSVKNIKDPIRVYRVLMDSKTTDKVVEENEISGKTSIIRNIAIVLIVIIAGILVWRFYPSQPEEQTPKTIAVLPFEDLSPEKDQEHFVLGLSEEILNSLTHIPDLTVIARTSSFSFKGQNKTAQEIAKELGADHVLEGSVRKSGNALKITAQLIRATDDSHIWSETYDRELKDIFEIQEDIAKNVADKLKLTLEAFQSLGGTKNIEAYELYLMAKGLRTPISTVANQKLELVDQAIQLDKNFALAWALKGMAHIGLVNIISSDLDNVTSQLDAAQKSSKKALELEPNLGKAHLVLGTVYSIRRQLIEAEKAYRKGMELTSESIDYFDYGLTNHYSNLGYLKKAVKILGEENRKDPLNHFVRLIYMIDLVLIGDIKRAKEESQSIKATIPQPPIPELVDMNMTMFRITSGDILSINEIPETVRADPIWSIILKYKKSPEKALEEFHTYINSNRMPRFFIMLLAAYLGDQKMVIESMENLTEVNLNPIVFLVIWSPAFHEVRQTSRFKELVIEMGFVDYWKQYGWPDLCRAVGEDDFVCD